VRLSDVVAASVCPMSAPNERPALLVEEVDEWQLGDGDGWVKGDGASGRRMAVEGGLRV
jgi:hypothetical protein